MIGKTLAKRYHIDALIGSGGMAVVYRARDLRTQNTVAVKVLRAEYSKDQEFLRRFDREAMACAKVQHPNIVNLIDIGEEDDVRYLVMEYVEGSTLKELIQERGRLPLSEAVRIALQSLAAIRHAHQKHIIHRDIKPQNILVDIHGNVKIADFGIARMTDSSTVTVGDGVMGSVHYFSPEQAKGKPVAEASDLYSMGVVLYEMLAGRVPFDGDAPVAVAMQHINDPAKPVSIYAPEVTPAVEQVLAKAMCKSLAQRYANAEQMAFDLRRALRQPEGGFVKMRPTMAPQDTLVHQPVSTREARSRRKWRGRMLFGLTLLLCAGVLGVIGFAGYSFWLHMTNYTAMPGVVGLEKTVALDVLHKAQIQAIIMGEHHDVVLPGFIISQEPLEGVEIARNGQALLHISLGSGQVQVPGVIGMTLEAAEVLLDEHGLSLGDVLVELSDAPVGQVIQQVPVAGADADDGMLVDLHVSGGVVVMPDLSNQPFTQVEATLHSLGLHVGDISFVDVDNSRQDTLVMSQDPRVGENVFPESEVDLSVGRFDSRPFRKEVSIQVQIPEGGAKVRVVLIDPDGRETEQYAAKHALAGTSTIVVELRSSISGSMVYRLYIDDVMADEKQILFE